MAITWKRPQREHGAAGWNGHLGKVRLFSIGYVGGKGLPVPATYYTAWIQGQLLAPATEDEAKDLAQRLLANWLTGIGAEMKQEASA